MIPDGIGDDEIPDERLGLIFACCHPALAREAQVPLTLRLVAGLTVPEIARSLLLPAGRPSRQRLVRAKRKIRDAGIPIEVPSGERLPDRLDVVLTVLSLVFTEGYVATGGPALRRDDLAEEAIRLTAILAVPDARRGRAGRPARADDAAPRPPRRARRRRRRAGAAGRPGPRASGTARRSPAAPPASSGRCGCAARPGRFALQAAIAAVHAEAPSAAGTDWPQILGLYDELMRRRALAGGRAEPGRRGRRGRGPRRGARRRRTRSRRTGALRSFAPLHAARADLLRRLGRDEEAAAAYAGAARLTGNPAERAFLEGRAAGA